MNNTILNTTRSEHQDILQFLSILGFVLVTLTVKYLLNIDLSLESLENGIFAEASIEGIDIAKRKNLIWKFLFSGSIISLIGFFCFQRLKHFDFVKKCLPLLSIISIAGLMAYWTNLIGVALPEVHRLILATFIFAPIHVIIKRIHNKEDDKSKSNFFEFVLALISVTVITYVFFPTGLTFVLRYLIIALVSLIGLYFTRNNDRFSEHRFWFYSAPFFYFIYLEFLVNSQAGDGLRGTVIFLLLTVLLSGFAFWLLKRSDLSKAKAWQGSLFILGMTTIAYHAYAISYPADQFEIANQANAMMRFFKFQEWPFIHYLSSHNLYDHLWPFLYSFINGYENNVSYLSYDFIRHAVTTVAGFILLTYLFRNWALAALFVLFFPFNRALFPMSMAIFMIIPWTKTFDSFQVKNIFLIMSLSVALIFWKMDVGFGNAFASLLLFIVYFVQFKSSENLKRFFKSSLFLATIAIIILTLVCLIFGMDTFTNHLSQALGYFSADQAHGLSNLTNDVGGRLFLIHYIAFPISIFALAVYLLIKFKEIYEHCPRVLISLLYFIFFYFANFQRGLVRHSFLSGTDAFLSSFVFLIFGLAVTLFLNKKRQLIGFIIVSIFFIHNFRLARTSGMHSIFEKLVMNIKTNPKEQIKNTTFVEGRMVDGNKPYRGIQTFMDQHFSNESTFLDFTNTPMLYFYTQRFVPSYFNQYLQNTVTNKLQSQNVNELKLKDIPVVIFQSHPKAWGDATDQVPNTLRYMVTTQYIFENYKPFKIIDGKEIWLQNNHSLFNNETAQSGLQSNRLLKYDLKKLPALKFATPESNTSINLTQKQSGFYSVGETDFTYNNNTLFLELDERPKDDLMVDLNFPDSTQVTLKFAVSDKQSQNYEIPLSWIYSYYKNFENISDLKIRVNSSAKIKELSIKQYLIQ